MEQVEQTAQRCNAPGCMVTIYAPYLHRVDGEPWCQPCLSKLVADMENV